MTPASRPYTVHWTVNISGHENNRNKVFYRIILTRSWNYYTKKAGLGIRSSVFWANRSFFRKKWANARFAQKSEQFAHSLIFRERPKRFAHGCSFLVSDLSKSLMVAHFWWATWAICSHRSFWWGTWAIRSHCSLKKRESANCSFFKIKNVYKTY